MGMQEQHGTTSGLTLQRSTEYVQFGPVWNLGYKAVNMEDGINKVLYVNLQEQMFVLVPTVSQMNSIISMVIN